MKYKSHKQIYTLQNNDPQLPQFAQYDQYLLIFIQQIYNTTPIIPISPDPMPNISSIKKPQKSIEYNIKYFQISILDNKPNPIIIILQQKKKQQSQKIKMDKHSWHRVHLNLQTNTLPVSRWGHSCCVIGNQIVYFGGYAQSVYMNDVWSFNTTTMQWTEIKTTGDIPSQRSNCSMSYDSENDRIVVFGGGGPNKKRFNTVNILNWMTKEWIEIQPKQNQPGPWERTYHCAELLYPYLVVFGGEGVTDMDDLWLFNFETMRWKEVPIDKNKSRPCGRRFHSSALVGNEFFVIGGCHGKYRCLSDVFSMDLTPLLKGGDIQTLQWKDRKPLGSAFLTRWGHSSSVYENKIYIFGGRFSNDLNDLLVLDLEKNTIKALKIVAELPKARRRHSACFIGSCMIIFGGFNGQYYNDLYYINVFELKSKLQVPPSVYQKSLQKFVNDTKFSDLHVKTQDNEVFYLHRGLLVNGLKNETKINSFLEKVDGSLSKKELQELVIKLYRGYGIVKEEQRQRYDIQIPETQEDYEQILKSQLLKCEDKSQNQSLIRKKSTLPIVIQLPDEQFSTFLDQNREYTYKDSSIVINQTYLLRTNSVALAIACQFFKNAFKGCYKDDEKQIKLKLNSNNLVIFEIILNYLLLDKLVVPQDMGLYSWMQLYEMADYFCLKRVMLICEQQICSYVTQKNCDEVLTFSLDLQMDTLALYCADFLIKCMVNREDKFFYEQTNCQAKNSVLEIMYNLSRFDILQVKLERMKSIQEGLKKKDSMSTQEDDKQNYEINNMNGP